MLYLKVVLLNIFVFFYLTAYASPVIFCPTIDEIRNEHYSPWLPLYIDREELASTNDVEQFKANVTSFSVAKWDQSYLENGHCFYKGNDSIVDKIIFAQDAWQPVTNSYWHWLDAKKLAACYTEIQHCGFIT